MKNRLSFGSIKATSSSTRTRWICSLERPPGRDEWGQLPHFRQPVELTGLIGSCSAWGNQRWLQLALLTFLEDVEGQNRRDSHIRCVDELGNSQVHRNRSNDIGLLFCVVTSLRNIVDHLQQGIPRGQ
jgi:hypothetical protein